MPPRPPEAVIEEFNKLLSERLGRGYRLFRYQEVAASRIISGLEEGSRFIVVSMPTGSGKTLVELLLAHYFLSLGGRVLVVEPTRFLVDQQYGNSWRRLFGDRAVKEYEGSCRGFVSSQLVVSTPWTALKCIRSIPGAAFDYVVFDEVHHVFGDNYYARLVAELEPEALVGFTALLPRERRERLTEELRTKLGPPVLMVYGFRELAEIDPSFTPPVAILDVFEAEMDKLEWSAYLELLRGRRLPLQLSRKQIRWLELELAKYGAPAMCASLAKRVEPSSLPEPLQRLCRRRAPSHKARALAAALKPYLAMGVSRPLLVFTSRRSSAADLAEAAANALGGGTVEVLTGLLSRTERLRLLSRARRGEIDVIVSTMVGEEGVDIPEAGLLVMVDVPRSSLRFYQRLGRLLRPRRRRDGRSPKYLAVISTPLTREHDKLRGTAQRLLLEGVDLSYVIPGLWERDSGAAAVMLVEELTARRSPPKVGFLELAGVEDPSIEDEDTDVDPLALILEALRVEGDVDPELLPELEKAAEELAGAMAAHCSNPSPGLREALAELLLKTGCSIGAPLEKRQKLVEATLQRLLRGTLDEAVSSALRKGRLIQVYDPSLLGPLVAAAARRASCCTGNKWALLYLSMKSVNRLFTLLALPEAASPLHEWLMKTVNEAKERLERLGATVRWRLGVGGGEGWLRVTARLELMGRWRYPRRITLQARYYDVPRDVGRRHTRLLEAGVLASALRGLAMLAEGPSPGSPPSERLIDC